MMRRRGQDGYIMLEAAVALVLLTAGVYAVHGSIRQAIEARGQAQDYTEVRFLLEKVLADVEMQPELVEHESRGTFPRPHERFSWSYSVRRIDLQLPELTEQLIEQGIRYPVEFLAHVSATVTWTRGGREYSESFETLFSSSKLWQPPEETAR
jgi:hypothetical protein